MPFESQVEDEDDKEIFGASTPMSQEDIEELTKYQSELEGQLIALKDLYDHGESDRKELMSDLDAIEEKVSRKSTFIGTTEQRQKPRRRGIQREGCCLRRRQSPLRSDQWPCRENERDCYEGLRAEGRVAIHVDLWRDAIEAF